MSNIGFLCVVLVLGAYNFTLPRVKKSTHIEPRNESLTENLVSSQETSTHPVSIKNNWL